MALFVIAAIAALTILAAKWRNSSPLLAATLGFLTFMVVPLYLWGQMPFTTRNVYGLIYGWQGALMATALAIVVYGGTGLLVEVYVRTSADARRIRVAFSMLLGAIISGLIYNVGMRLLASGGHLSYGGLAHVVGVGALVALVVSFALTHVRRPGVFFASRDGGTVVSAIIGASVVMGGLNLVLQQLPNPYPMPQIVTNLLLGSLLGAGLTIPLRAVKAGRVARAALGAVIGGVVLANVSGIGAAPLQGFLAGGAVGALLPDEEVEDDQPVIEAETPREESEQGAE